MEARSMNDYFWAEVLAPPTRMETVQTPAYRLVIHQ